MMIKCQLSVFFLLYVCSAFAQQTASEPLPARMLATLKDSTNSIDLVLLQGGGGSLSAEGDNVKFFNSFIENATAKKEFSNSAGTMMWLINGREFISGNYFLGDSTGYVVFQKDGKEYVNLLNRQGNAFFKTQFK